MKLFVPGHSNFDHAEVSWQYIAVLSHELLCTPKLHTTVAIQRTHELEEGVEWRLSLGRSGSEKGITSIQPHTYDTGFRVYFQRAFDLFCTFVADFDTN